MGVPPPRATAAVPIAHSHRSSLLPPPRSLFALQGGEIVVISCASALAAIPAPALPTRAAEPVLWVWLRTLGGSTHGAGMGPTLSAAAFPQDTGTPRHGRPTPSPRCQPGSGR